MFVNVHHVYSYFLAQQFPSLPLLPPPQQQRLGELHLHVRAQRRGLLAPLERKLRGAHDVLLRAGDLIRRSHPTGATRAGLELDVALGAERLPDGVPVVWSNGFYSFILQ